MLRFSVLPLTVVAALTPHEHEVRIIDENVEPLDFDSDCDVVGITFMTALAPRAYEIADRFRRRGTIVVAGGYHATLCPEDAAPHFDALVLGDAEGAWERLLADLREGKLEKLYRQADGGAPASASRRACSNTDSTPRTCGAHRPALCHDQRRTGGARLPPQLPLLFRDGLSRADISKTACAGRGERTAGAAAKLYFRGR